MSNRLRPRTNMSLGGLSLRQLAVGMWKRMEEHDSMTWAAAVAFYAMLATVPFLALVLVGVVLRLPDLSGAGGRTDRPRSPDSRPARGDAEVALPERSLRPGQGPDRAHPG